MGLVHAWWSHLYSGRKGSHLFHSRSHAAAWEALLEGRVWHLAMCGWRGKVWPGSPSSLMWCDSSAKKSSYWLHLLLLGSGLWTILFCQIFLCMADAWIISGQMAGFGDIFIWAISKSFGDVSSLVLTASTSHSIPTEWAVPGFKWWEGQVLELSNVLSKNHRRVQKGMCTLKDWNSNSDFFQKLKSI